MNAIGTIGRTRQQSAVLSIVLASYLMIVLDISIVITALPKIGRELAFSTAALSWVQNAYTLAFGGLLLLGARAGDILGRRRMFLVGLQVFVAASMVVGMASSAPMLLLARALQGVGAAILAPATLALLSTYFPPGPQRTRAVAWYGAVAGIGASVGLVLGGVLADGLSWRVGFFINLPIGLVLLVAASRCLVKTARRPGAFDLPGALCSTFGMGSLVYGIVRSATAGWSDAISVVALGLGLLLLVALVANEACARQPIMPLHLFADRERAGAYAARALFLGAMMGFWFFTTQFLQGVLGYSAFAAGNAFLPMTLANVAVAMAVPRLTGRIGNVRLLAIGLLVALIGMTWLSRLNAEAGYLLQVGLPMLLIGAGQGAALSPLTVSGMARVDSEDAGAASGLVNVAHQLGGSLGLGILVALSAGKGAGALDAGQALAQRVSGALGVASIALAMALLLVLVLIVRPWTGRVVND